MDIITHGLISPRLNATTVTGRVTLLENAEHQKAKIIEVEIAQRKLVRILRHLLLWCLVMVWEIMIGEIKKRKDQTLLSWLILLHHPNMILRNYVFRKL